MLGLGLVIYGAEGIGKTSFSLEFSNLGKLKILSIGETGYEDLSSLKDYPNVQHVEVERYEDIYREITDNDAKFLVVDSLQGLQLLLFDYVCRTDFDADWERFISYYQGPRVNAVRELDELLHKFNELRRQKVSVILLGHMITDKVTNAMGADYLTYTIEMDEGDKGGVRSLIRKWAQAILFMNVDIKITQGTEVDRATRKVKTGKASETSARMIYTEKSATYLAKNRLNLPPVIPMGDSPEEAFENFLSALPEKVRNSLVK